MVRSDGWDYTGGDGLNERVEDDGAGAGEMVEMTQMVVEVSIRDEEA